MHFLDQSPLSYNWALKRVNEALIEALKMAIFALEKQEELLKRKKKVYDRVSQGSGCSE